MKKNRKWVLLLIIAFPSLFWLILETSTINSHRLPYLGPKHPVAPGDTEYYHVPNITVFDSTIADGAFEVMFVKESYSDDSFRLAGLWEYVKYKQSKLNGINMVMVTTTGVPARHKDVFSSLSSAGIHVMEMDEFSFKNYNEIYFREKPVHVDYSFMTLVDATGAIRGYYDLRYLDEVKRMIDEYRHLRIRDEKQALTKSNEITKKP